MSDALPEGALPDDALPEGALPDDAVSGDTRASSGEFADCRRNVEALLFAAGSPLSVDAITAALSASDPAPREMVERTLVELAADFPAMGVRGFELAQLAGGWAFRTNPCCQSAVSALFELPDDVTRLSPASMEALAIVAYLQPVSRPQIGEIRGVNSDSPVRTLLERELIAEVGRSHGGGGAVLYGTTRRFEVLFGLAGLEQLPSIEGFALSEGQKEDLRRRLGLLALSE